MDNSNETGTPNPLPPEQNPDTMPEQDGGKHPSRRKAAVAAVAAAAAIAVCAGGYGVWRVHEDRLDEQARTDCSQAAKTLDTSRATWERLLKDAKTGAGAIQANQVKDAKTVDALKQAMGAKTPTGSASCTAGDRTDVENAATAIRKTAGTYDANRKALAKAVKAVEASRLDKTVADASRLLDDTKGRVADDRTRQALDKAIKARDEQAIAKAVKAVNDSRTAKEKADAEAKARAEQEAAAAAAAAAQQAQQSWSSSGSGYTGNGYSTGGYSGNTWSGGSPTSTGGGTSTPSTPSGGSSGSSSSGSTGGSVHYDWEDRVTTNESCASGGFCPLG